MEEDYFWEAYIRVSALFVGLEGACVFRASWTQSRSIKTL